MLTHRVPSLALCYSVGLLFLCSTVDADVFPAAPQDGSGISSFGTSAVYIVVDAPWQAEITQLINSGFMPGYVYSSATHVLRTPGMYDSNAKFGFSGSLKVGSAAATNGVTVGVASPVTVSATSFTTIPPGFTGPAGSNEVFTQNANMNMTTMGVGSTAVTIGASAADRPNSLGAIQSNSNSGIPANDFPAHSFFDVFADITLDFGSNIGSATLNNSNNTPFVIQQQGMTSLPSMVLPFGSTSTGAPITFQQSNFLGGWVAGDQFGVAYIAGAGSPGPTVPEPSTIILFCIGAISLAGRKFLRVVSKTT